MATKRIIERDKKERQVQTRKGFTEHEGREAQGGVTYVKILVGIGRTTPATDKMS